MDEQFRMETEEHHHHHHHEKVFGRRTAEAKKIVYALAYAASAVSAVWLVLQMFPFIKSMLYYHQINAASILYLLLGFALMVLPATVIIPTKLYKDYISKLQLIKSVFMAISILFFASAIVDILVYNILGGYVDEGESPIVIKLLWNNVSYPGIIFSLVEGYLYLKVASLIKGHKADVCKVYFTAIIFYILAPLVFQAFTVRDTFFTPNWNKWFLRNLYFYLNQILTWFMIFVASRSRHLWASCIWH